MLVRMIVALSAILMPTPPAAAQDCQHFAYEDPEALIRQASTFAIRR
jgi:hypothetical protein